MSLTFVRKPSPHFNDRPEGIKPDMIIIHAMGYEKKRCLDILTGAPHEIKNFGRVSAHYLIDHDGTIYQIVEEEKRAWHAGISSWENRENLNDFSIGIELLNKDECFDCPFEEAQINALLTLITDIRTRYTIPIKHILGHDQISPGRKTDPGPHFPWDALKKLHLY